MTQVESAWLAYQRQLFLFIRARVATAEDAEDILNDVFTKLIKHVADNQVPDNISPWLYRVTKNSVVDYYRTTRTFDQLPADLAEEQDDASAITELAKCLLPMILSLPETYQRPLILSEIEGKKYKQLSIELNLSVPAVKSRILRGREKLYNSMARCCTIHRNNAGQTIAYEQKEPSSCEGC